MEKNTRLTEWKVWCLRNQTSSSEVARKIGITPTHFCLILNGDDGILREHADKLAGLGVPMELLPPIRERRKPGRSSRKQAPVPEQNAMLA